MKRILALCLLILPAVVYAAAPFVSFSAEPDGMAIVADGTPVNIILDADADEGIRMAAESLCGDFMRVTGRKTALLSEPEGNCIVIGTLDSPLIRRFVKSGDIDETELKGKNEKFLILTAGKPRGKGRRSLVIAGSDRRGVIYGIYELSRQMGVSPWYWWADVPVTRRENVWIKPGTYTDGEPKVAYRGIFINDEWPSFGNWAVEHFGGINSECYRHVFELILRLKGNFLWPAMWGSAFYDDDKENGPLADRMGVVMGTSHHEPMALAQQDWKRYGHGDWNYVKNEEELQKFWKGGIERSKDWEKVVTIGMRGDGDEAMEDSGNISLMEKIIADQRRIIEEVTGDKAENTPQVWALYKEVQEYYDKGMKVPDDVILLLCDDNWGNVRRVPPVDGIRHKGGYGMYYHVDYVGAPRNSKWINISPTVRMWDQLNLTYRYGIDKLWILNVGDIKPMEYPITFFMDMAWNPDAFNPENLIEHSERFCSSIFGEQEGPEAARLLRTYAKFNRRVTPELLDKDTYSLHEYDEWARVVAEYDLLAREAITLGFRLPADRIPAWYQIIAYPIMATANLYDMYYAQAMNHDLAACNDPNASLWAERVEACFENDREFTKVYHELLDGKWNHIMDEIHIGYTSWNTPPEQIMPEVVYVEGVPSDTLSLPEAAPIRYNEKVECPVFKAKDGYVSIEAEHYSRKTDGIRACWTILPEMGRTLSAITPLPVTAPVDDMALEYDVEVPEDIDARLILRFSPSLNFNVTGLRYAVSFNGGEEQIININGDFDGETGHRLHREHVIDSESSHRLKKGRNILRIRPLDPNLSLQKIMMDLGGLKPSFLGPPETL